MMVKTLELPVPGGMPVRWLDEFLKNTSKAKEFEEHDEKIQAQILKWESDPYKVIGS